jgi:hypothetical protein
MEILKTYEDASGQEINLSKSEVFFSRNISRAAQEDLSNLMGVRHVMGTGTYLGMPSMVGRSKKATFAYIKDRIWRKINSWRSRPLSKAGNEVMIKSVLQAIPSYVMSLYIIPDATMNDIEKMLNSFWWGGGDNNKGIRWLSWERIACAKMEGGLGFRDFKSFNMAMVAKQGWKIMTRPETLVAKIFKARWNIGDGSKIKVMNTPWIRGKGSGWVSAPQPQAAEILMIPLLRDVKEDRLVWKEEQDGEYKVRSGYRLLMNEKEDVRMRGLAGNWKSLWQIRTPPKAKHILWRICRECLPTRTRLQQHHVQCPTVCELCRGADKDVWHVLFDCEESKQCWTVAGLQNIISSRLEQFHEVKEVIFYICSKETKEVAERVALVIWLLWNNRNQWLWNHEKRNATQIGVQAIHMWNEWFELQKCSIRTPENEQVQQQMRWTPPRQGWIKCNVDASIHCEGRITSGGWCFRNDIRQFLRAGTYWKNVTYSVLEAEALVLLEAMQVASTMNLEYTTFESDS